MTVTPTNIHNVVHALEEYLEYLEGVDTQVFWAPLGAVVLTDTEVYEVYESGDDVVIQARGLELQTRWEDITEDVLAQ
jgi:hypothetical protein